MRKRDMLQEIHDLLMLNYGYEIGSVMFLYMIQKKQGLSYGEANTMMKQDLTFLRNAPKRKDNIGAFFGI